MTNGEQQRRWTVERPGAPNGGNGGGNNDYSSLREMQERCEAAFRDVGQRSSEYTKKHQTTAGRTMRTTNNRSGQ